MRALERMRLGRSVKEAVDNLPEGVCFFDRSGLPILCNHRMYDLVFRMTGRDLQSLSEPESSLRGAEDGVFPMADGSIWSFTFRSVRTGPRRSYTLALAADVTELHREQERLRQANEAQRRALKAIEAVQKNVVALTREEEVLAMKMRLHNDLGYDLQMIHRFLGRGFAPEEKARFIAQQRRALRRLRIREEAPAEPLRELTDLAASLDMRLELTGELPAGGPARDLLPLILRECLINTVRHAHGDALYAVLTREGPLLRAELTNSGAPPAGPIAEGGGLSSLRERIETAGGSMALSYDPVFRLTVRLPVMEKEEDQ